MGETTFLILGGYGNTGMPVARLLLRETDAHVVLAGRSIEKAETAARDLNEQFPGDRVTARRADAADTASLAAAFEGVDFVLVASSTSQYAGQVARAALDAGIDYLDIHYYGKKNEQLHSLAGEIESAGRCFITEAGFHPGLPSALVRWAAARCDGSIESAEVAALFNMEGDIPLTESLYELVETFKDYQALEFRDGAWRKCGWSGYRKIDFGPEFGSRWCVPMFFEEMRALPSMLPTLRRAGFVIAGWNWFTDWIVSPIMMLALKLWPRRAVRPMAKLLHWSLKFARPPYGVLLKVTASAPEGESWRDVEALLYHPDGYEFTAIPVVACLLQYLDGSARKPGL